jgi:membrane associated rhomboid family serine protease
MTRVPVANWVLIAVTTLVSISVLLGLWPRAEDQGLRDLKDQHLTAQQEFDAILTRAVREAMKPSGPPLALRPDAPTVFQLFSHLFVHADVIHLVINMLFLFAFGNAVNAKLGHGMFVLSYLGLGVLAGAAWLFWGDGRPAVGASGAIMGLMGIFVILFPRNDVCFGFTGETRVASCWVVLAYLVCDLLATLFVKKGAVAYVAHLAGGLGGIALGILMVVSGWASPTEYEENFLQLLGFQPRPRHYVDYYW